MSASFGSKDATQEAGITILWMLFGLLVGIVFALFTKRFWKSAGGLIAILAGLFGPLLIARVAVNSSGGPDHVSLVTKIVATLVALLLVVVIVELLTARARAGSLLGRAFAAVLSSVVVLNGLVVPVGMFGRWSAVHADQPDATRATQRAAVAPDKPEAANGNAAVGTDAGPASDASVEASAWIETPGGRLEAVRLPDARWQLRLNGRAVQSLPSSVANLDFYEPVLPHTIGGSLLAHVVIVRYRQDATACPEGKFAFLLVKPDGATELSDAFGTCEKPKFGALPPDRIYASFPTRQPGMVGTETWSLHAGRLSASSAEVRPAPDQSLPAIAIDPHGGHTKVTLQGSIQVTPEGWYEFVPSRKLRTSAPGSVCDGQEVDRFPYTQSATDTDASLAGKAGVFDVQLWCWEKYAYVGVASVAPAATASGGAPQQQ